MTNFEKELDDILLSPHPEISFYKKAQESKDFFNKLNEIFPELRDCYNEPQNNKWHIYNVLDHTLHSIKNINELSTNLPTNTQKVLAYTMFYHDLGKPKALKINLESVNPTHSFAYHQELSAEIVDRTIKNFSFNEDEQEQIYGLVKYHDYFMLSYKNTDKYIKNQDTLKECIKDDITFFGEGECGKNFLNNIVLVSKADNLAQNPELTGPSLEFLYCYESLLNKIDYNQSPNLEDGQ